jgi:hypothetical protein
MTDNSLLPISDEQAKLGQELVKAMRDGGGYFADILGDFPQDLFGLLIGDRVKAKRIERIAVLWQKTRERLEYRGTDPEPPSLKYATMRVACRSSSRRKRCIAGTAQPRGQKFLRARRQRSRPPYARRRMSQ